MNKEYVNVVFPLPIEQAFTYLLPEDLKEVAQIGCRVIAPFGPRRLTGFITEFCAQPSVSELKEIQDVVDLQPVVSPEMLALAKWIAGYYLCSLGEALKVTLPAGFLQASQKVIRLFDVDAEKEAAQIERTAPRQAQILRYVAKSGDISLPQLKRKIGARSLISSLNQLEQRGFLNVTEKFKNMPMKPKTEKYVRLRANGNALREEITQIESTAPKQVSCLQYLKENGPEALQSDLLKQAQAPLSSLKSLEKKNLIEFFTKTVTRDYYSRLPVKPPQKLTLNAEQSAALREIEKPVQAGAFQAFLLHGITGSGKTQVYIEAIYRVLEKGRDAIVLVPEISLTPQTVQRFRSHFKDQVAVLHSAMSQGERVDSWRRLQSGQAKVAIGPRSAIFAPLKNVGLIVVDEEHESSYKQGDTNPRYHARDVAVVRAKQNDAVVILGSATPSTESYFNALQGKYELLDLKRRINDVPLPEVKVIDMLKERRLSGQNATPVLSRLLRNKIEQKLAAQEQVILLLNRRGFSSYIKCRECGYVEECEHCNITMTFHLHGRRLRCHYCGSTQKAPSVCPDCRGEDILFRGIGTQQVEQDLTASFPQSRIVRMDLDTTSRKWSHDRILQGFGQGKYDILLGTQMVAKGLDFHRVTLVGVINADIGLLLPDFRSTERTFQLLTQVAGRAGRRDLPGEVIIQTFSPDSFCLDCAKKHDFSTFFSVELQARQELGYPPFGKIVYILFKGEEENSVAQAARFFGDILKSAQHSAQILGPIPSPIAKIKNKYRWQILVKANRELDQSGRRLRETVQRAEQRYKQEARFRDVNVIFDVDPMAVI